MKKSFKTGVIKLLVGAIILTAIAGCTPARKPAPQQQTTEPTISLYVNETGEVKRLKMEDYLEGVVAAEMDPKWPANALAAQAIIARTFTLKQIKDRGGVPKYGTDASTNVEEFQAYDPTRINDNVRAAVNMTRGEVVKHEGRYINAWFSACDGGVVASAPEGLAFKQERTPYINAGAKDGCLEITVPENQQWTASFPLPTVRSAVQKIMGTDPGVITSGNVSVAKRGPSGRAETLKIGNATVGSAALRLALGSEKMRSIFLDNITVQNGNLVMTGKGFGHGVGLCQWGAKKQAAEGKKPEDIVRFYFKNVTIDKLWE